MTFEQAWKIVDPVGTWDALMEDGARVLWDEVTALGWGKHLVEIGCHYGRSSTLWMLLAKAYQHRLTFIDPWGGPPFANPVPVRGGESEVAAAAWFRSMRSFEYPFTLHCSKTEQIDPRQYPRSIDFLYVDGEHTAPAVEIDCRMIESVNPGGIIAFDNYGTHGGVEEVTDRLMREGRLIKRSLTGIMLVTQKAS